MVKSRGSKRTEHPQEAGTSLQVTSSTLIDPIKKHQAIPLQGGGASRGAKSQTDQRKEPEGDQSRHHGNNTCS